MKFLLPLLLFFGCTEANAVPRILDADIVRGIRSVQNNVKNPEFETNIANVTDGGAGIITWSTVSPVDNTGSLVINSLVSGEIVKIQTKAQQKKLEGQGCVADFYYTGNASNYKAYVLNGITNVSGDFPLANAGGGTNYQLIPFPCQAAGDTVDIAIESTAITAGQIKLDSIFEGQNFYSNLPGFTLGSVLFSDGTKITEDNANFFWDDAANTLKLRGSLFELGTVDAFARRQIWNHDTSAILRLGSWGQDGDALNSSSEGIVVYGDSLTGQPISATDGGYARIKQNRFGLFTVDSTLPSYAGGDYFFRADNTSMYYKDDSAIKTFEVTRATGNITTPGSYVGTGSVMSKTSLVLEDPGAGTNTVTIQSGVPTASYTLTLPINDGAAGEVLSTNGSGVLSWVPDATGVGSPILAVVTKVANYTLVVATDDLVICDTSSNDITLTLPTAVGNTGKQFFIKKSSDNFSCIIDGNAAETIDEELTQVLHSKHMSVTVVSDGSNWLIL